MVDLSRSMVNVDSTFLDDRSFYNMIGISKESLNYAGSYKNSEEEIMNEVDYLQ